MAKANIVRRLVSKAILALILIMIVVASVVVAKAEAPSVNAKEVNSPFVKETMTNGQIVEITPRCSELLNIGLKEAKRRNMEVTIEAMYYREEMSNIPTAIIMTTSDGEENIFVNEEPGWSIDYETGEVTK